MTETTLPTMTQAHEIARAELARHPMLASVTVEFRGGTARGAMTMSRDGKVTSANMPH